jgi:hypothetical protein
MNDEIELPSTTSPTLVPTVDSGPHYIAGYPAHEERYQESFKHRLASNRRLRSDYRREKVMGYIHPPVYALLVGPPPAGPVDCFLSFYEVDGGVLLVCTPDNNSCALAKLYDNMAAVIQETQSLGMVNDAIAAQLSELKPGWKENGTIFQAKTIKTLLRVCGAHGWTNYLGGVQ